MKRRDFLKTIGAGMVGLTAAPRFGAPNAEAAPARLAERPNVIIIFTDDQGYGDLGCYGAEDLQTPNLDALARGGTRFTDFHVQAASCLASRAALLTGCQPRRMDLYGNNCGGRNEGMNPEEFTLGRMFKSIGYRTACIGKWHLGGHPACMPPAHGFDRFVGLRANPKKAAAKEWLAYDSEVDVLEAAGGDPDKELLPPLFHDPRIVEYPCDLENLTVTYTREAVRFIEENREDPFFIYLPHNRVHHPRAVAERFRGTSSRGLYGDMIREIDWSTGEIRRALERLGLAQNTLIIFTSDNGQTGRGGSAGPWRGGKQTWWEGGHRMPCITWWPGHIPAGRTCDELLSSMDLLPTLAGMVGVELPRDRVIDGEDVRDVLFGQEGATSPHDLMFWYQYQMMLVARRSNWKLFRKADQEWPRWYPHRFDRHHLYDLQEDPGETTNVADDHPEIVGQLVQAMDNFDAELKANIRPRFRAPRDERI